MDTELLKPWHPLRTYVATMRHMIHVWGNFFQTREIDWVTAEHVSAWLDRLKNTFDALENMYIYDDLQTLRIEREQSGFPRPRHLDLLCHRQKDLKFDAKDLRKSKGQFLDALFSTREVNLRSLEKVAKVRTDRLLATRQIYHAFRLLGIEERNSPTTGRNAFVCVWERFTEKPAFYVMLFEADDVWSAGDDLDSIAEIVKGATSHDLALEAIARRIDISDARVHPKWLGRVVLGPVWISNLTLDDHVLQNVVNEVRSDQNHAASKIVYEYVFSERESSISRVRDAEGREHHSMQTYGVRLGPQYRKRGVTFFEETLFIPHEVIQCMDETWRVENGHQLISI